MKLTTADRNDILRGVVETLWGLFIYTIPVPQLAAIIPAAAIQTAVTTEHEAMVVGARRLGDFF